MNKPKRKKDIPLALLIFPPIYDFALYDLFIKPYALLRIGKWLKKSGYKIKLVNYLRINDTAAVKKLGAPKRKKNGTGKGKKKEREKKKQHEEK